MRTATKQDWNDLQPMPPEHTRIELDLSFDARQMRNLHLGSIPVDQDQKWFLYFEDDTLHIHRSWTGFKPYEVGFEPDGDGARAVFARVNLDREYYSCTLDEAREALLELLDWFSGDEAHEPHESGMVAALNEASKPGYLGSPEVVMELLNPFFEKAYQLAIRPYLSEPPAAGFNDVIAANVQVCAAMCDETEGYHGLEAWRTEGQLGKAAIEAFGLDANWYADENLNCILSEGLAGISSQIGTITHDWAQSEAPDIRELAACIRQLQGFVASVLIGSSPVLYPDRKVADFTWAEAESLFSAQTVEEEQPQSGPPLHPRSDDDGKPVKLAHPSTPTAQAAWHDPERLAVVIPDGRMPDSINGVEVRTWGDAPRNASSWEALAAENRIDEPVFPRQGKKAAAGAIVVEEDGRIWLVAPSNAFGGYQKTFPKGTCEVGMSMQATALREVFEESGLRVELTSFLADVPRTTSVTRYYLARRIGGNPADMCWESQAVMLAPVSLLPELLNNKNDQPLIAALQRLQAQG